MGCNRSKVFIVNSEKQGQSKNALDDFLELELSAADINKLYNEFLKFDDIGEEDIDLSMFSKKLKIEMTKLLKKIIFTLDRDNTGRINFHNVCMNIYCFIFISI